jgi:hypothetical protein
MAIIAFFLFGCLREMNKAAVSKRQSVILLGSKQLKLQKLSSLNQIQWSYRFLTYWSWMHFFAKEMSIKQDNSIKLQPLHLRVNTHKMFSDRRRWCGFILLSMAKLDKFIMIEAVPFSGSFFQYKIQSLYCEAEDQRKNTQKGKECRQIRTNWRCWYAYFIFRCCLIKSALFCARKQSKESQ